jgi:superfamily II DNA or RNA helicase
MSKRRSPASSSRKLPALRRYQQEAVEAAAVGLAAGGRGQLRAACGTGKTIVGVHVARRLCPRGLVVVACPSLALVAQTLKTWIETGVTAHVLVVCGDDTVADAAVHAADLDCPITTDPREISEWVDRTPKNQPRLIMVTHTSAGMVGAGLAAAEAIADLLIVDEAHRTAGQLGKHVALVHDDAHLPARARLYMTATPRILTPGRRKNEVENVLSMDDLNVFGPVFHEYAFSRAIADGWLDDYRVVVIGVTNTEALALLRRVDHNAVIASHGTPLRTLVAQTALARAAFEFNLRRVLAFCPRVRQSQEFARTLHRAVMALPDEQRPKGLLTVGHVDGAQTVAQRNRHLARLAEPPEGGWTVVSNARCLSEGVDVPALDGVFFTWRKDSEVDVVQAVGRAVRRHAEGSGIATILVPVLLPDDPQHTGGLGEWAALVQVLRALRAHDASLAAELDTQRGRMSTKGVADLPSRIVLRLPEEYDSEALLSQITVRVLEGTTSDWLVGLAAAQAFHAEHGHLRVPYQDAAGDTYLSIWVRNARAAFQLSQLAPDRVAALDELGMEWFPHQADWQRGFTAAQTFYREHGHLRAPAGMRINGVNLNAWLNSRRINHRAGKLSADRFKALTDLCSDWFTSRGDWERALAAARKFHAQHGHLRVTKGQCIDGINVGNWLIRQRFLHRRGELAAERVAALNALNIDWNPLLSMSAKGTCGYLQNTEKMVSPYIVGCETKANGCNEEQ